MVLELDLYYFFKLDLCCGIFICGFMTLLYVILGFGLLIVELWLDFIYFVGKFVEF